MKKLVAVLLALVMTFGLVACGQTQEEQKVDVDLTKLSSTMVYAEVSNMCTEPTAYVDKIVKMKGKMAVYPGDQRNYYACIISDATACCAQGIEFLTKDGQYPQVDSEFTVTGKFEIYYEGANMYIQLADAVVE